MSLGDDTKTAVVIGNPRSADFEVKQTVPGQPCSEMAAMLVSVCMGDDKTIAMVIGYPHLADYQVRKRF